VWRSAQVVLVRPGFQRLEAVDDQVVGRELAVEARVEGVGERGERPRGGSDADEASAASLDFGVLGPPNQRPPSSAPIIAQRP